MRRCKKLPRPPSKADTQNEKRLKAFAQTGLSTNQRKLAQALKVISELPVEDVADLVGSNRHRLQDAVDHLWSRCGAEVELEVMPGTHKKLACLSFGKTLEMMIATYPFFRDMLLDLWKAKPCTKSDPYSLMIYGDELVPGNVLHMDTTRKVFGCQCCIKDFGPHWYKRNAAWIPLFCMRHNMAARIPGGMSYIMRMYLRHLLFEEGVRDRGIVLNLQTDHGSHVVLYFQISNLIADGDALRMLTNWKGAKGKLPCLCCLNVLGTENIASEPEGFVDLHCSDKSLFVAATNEDWWGRADALEIQVAVLNKSAFKKLEIASGLKYNPKGILWDKDLRRHFGPIDVCTYDAMHTMLVDGLGQAEISCALQFLSSLGESWDSIDQMMHADWKMCHLHKKELKGLRDAFSAKREEMFKKNYTFHSDASSLISIFPVFGYYLEAVAKKKHGDVLNPVLESYHACACSIALCKEGKTDGAVAKHLDEAMLKHAEKKAIAYPNERARAKDHWRYHLGDQIKRDGGILDCFAGERVNRSFKQCAQEVTFNNSVNFGFEASVLKRTMVRCRGLWDNYSADDALEHPAASEQLSHIYGANAFLSSSMITNGCQVVKNDIVLLDGHPYFVVGCASVGGDLAIVSREFTFVRQETAAASRWTYSSEEWLLKWVSDHVLRFPVAWFEDGDSCVILAL